MKTYIQLTLCLSFFLLASCSMFTGFQPIQTLNLSNYSGETPSINRIFPADSGMINVKTAYSAKGDGLTDDTAAIQNAISANIGAPTKHILYFPNGTYLISQPIVWKDTNGNWGSFLVFQGQSQTQTILKLTDHNSSYQNSNAPEDVIMMASGNPISQTTGGGNNGFDNFLFDITVDVGIGNPGAVAVDFMGNNYCGMRNVTLLSSDPQHLGSSGISMLRYASGPCLMKNITINGFDTAITANSFDYGITFEFLNLLNQRVVGILNNTDILSIRKLTSNNNVPVIQNTSSAGLITLIDSTFSGTQSAVAAIQNSGTLFARNVSAINYASAIQDANGNLIPGTSILEYSSGPSYQQFDNSPPASLNLSIQETPNFEEQNLSNWQSVVALGADPTGNTDSTQAIQAALDSGATTIYFPSGTYNVSASLLIRGKVRMIEGFSSDLIPIGNAFQNSAVPMPFFVVENSTVPNVTIDHIILGWWAQSYPGAVWISNSSVQPLIIKDVNFWDSGQLAAYRNTPQGTGTLFIEDAAAFQWQIQYPETVFARQLDPEGSNTKVLNNGGTLWILGIKTEQSGTIIETDNGGETELLGGFIYPLGSVPVNEAAFVINNSKVSLTYAVTSYTTPNASAPDGNFKTQVQETQQGSSQSMMTSGVLSRGYGNMMPLYSTAH